MVLVSMVARRRLRSRLVAILTRAYSLILNLRVVLIVSTFRLRVPLLLYLNLVLKYSVARRMLDSSRCPALASSAGEIRKTVIKK